MAWLGVHSYSSSARPHNRLPHVSPHLYYHRTSLLLHCIPGHCSLGKGYCPRLDTGTFRPWWKISGGFQHHYGYQWNTRIPHLLQISLPADRVTTWSGFDLDSCWGICSVFYPDSPHEDFSFWRGIPRFWTSHYYELFSFSNMGPNYSPIWSKCCSIIRQSPQFKLNSFICLRCSHIAHAEHSKKSQ